MLDKIKGSFIVNFFRVLILLPLLISTLVSQITSTSQADLAQQLARVEQMRAGDVPICDEQSFADFNLNDNNLKLNEVRTLATHNSYKNDVYPATYEILSGLFGSKTANSYHYAHDTLVSQLQVGVRSFEIDLRYINGEFRVFHMPGLDMSTHCADFPLTLEELRLWSLANPNHVPITILFEIKIDTVLFSPNVDKMLSALDAVLLDSLGEDKIETPADLMGECDTLTAMSSQGKWQTLNDTRGKFILLLHHNPIFTPKYIDFDDSLKTQVMVPCLRESSKKELFEKYAAYIMENDPSKEFVSEWVQQGLIVRTRMDDSFVYDEQRKNAALTSGAQILTTDLECGRVLPQGDYNAYLHDGYTIVEKTK